MMKETEIAAALWALVEKVQALALIEAGRQPMLATMLMREKAPEAGILRFIYDALLP
jgi:hypothetical protein